jgi:hypothetical protein
VGGAIVAVARAVADFLKDLVAEAVGEVLVVLVSLGLLGAVAVVVLWASHYLG